MEDSREDLQQEKEEVKKDPYSEPGELKGFYGKMKVSVRTLDIAIVVGIIAIVAVLAFAMQHRGYTVRFDSMGGTPVEAQTHMYGELVEEPEDPTREGYSFAGWYQDASYRYQWIMDESRVSESMTLYACWEEQSP